MQARAVKSFCVYANGRGRAFDEGETVDMPAPTLESLEKLGFVTTKPAKRAVKPRKAENNG